MTTTTRSGSTSSGTRSGSAGRSGKGTPSRRARPAAGQRGTSSTWRASVGPAGRTNASAVVALVVALSTFGLAMVLSSSSVKAFEEYGSSWYFFERQAVALAVGFLAMLVASRVDHRLWQRYAPAILVVSLVLMTAVILPFNPLSLSRNGARRWLGSGSLQFQPSEFAKLAVIFFCADLLSRRSDKLHNEQATMRPVIAVLAAVAFLLMLEPDLGTTILISIVALAMLVMAGVHGRSLSMYALPVTGLVIVAVTFSAYRMDRVLAFLNPWAHATDEGYQTIEAQIGFQSGGVFGLGVGGSRAKWGFLPEAHTDFIYTIIGEELGLLGSVGLLAMFLLFGYVGRRVALAADSRFGALVATGITTWITAQALINMGVNVGALPNKGIPLPFISYGGSSVIVTMFAAGILANIAAGPRTPPVKAKVGGRRG